MNIIATKKLFTTLDGTKLVPDGDPEAAFLFCTPGQRIEPKRLARLTNAKEHFEKEIASGIKEGTAQMESVASEVVAASHKRVEPEAAPATVRKPTVKSHG